MLDKVWLNILAIPRHTFGQEQLLFFREIVDFISRNEASWRKWYDENEPESCPVPDYEERLVMEKTLGNFVRLALVRCVRGDYTAAAEDADTVAQTRIGRGLLKKKKKSCLFP